MKKTYIAPAAEVLSVEAESMVCVSLGLYESTNETVERAAPERNFDPAEFAEMENCISVF